MQSLKNLKHNESSFFNKDVKNHILPSLHYNEIVELITCQEDRSILDNMVIITSKRRYLTVTLEVGYAW